MKTNFFRYTLFTIFCSFYTLAGIAQNPVEIYTMPGCGRCAYTMEYVKKNNIKYIEYSTSNDDYNTKMWELLGKTKGFNGGSITMPVVVKGGTTYFNIEKLEEFVTTLGNGQNQNNNNQNHNNTPKIVKKTGCISGNCVNGTGVFVFDNQDKYDGSFANSTFSGKGKYTWAEGGVYIGEWKDGQQNGYGTYTDENGNVQQGTWEAGNILDETSVNENEYNNDFVNNGNNSNINSSDLTKAQIKEFIDTHNAYRSKVNVGPLTWSNELATYAKAWGQHLAEIGCEMEHRPKSGEWAQKYGENLYWCSGYAATPAKAVNSWGEEKKDYDGGVMNNKNFVAGHYTQMIWANTTQVGCAIIQCSDGAYIVVCNYNPAGNYWGQSPLKK